MEKINVETNYNVMKELAKQLGIKFVGVKKKDLVELINKAINEQEKAPKKGKWFEEEGAYPFESGDVVEVLTHDKVKALIGRRAIVTQPSRKKNATKAYLISPKDGGPQGTHITLDFKDIQKVEFQLPALVPSRILA